MKRSLEMLERDFHLAGNSSVRGTLPVQFLERSADSAAAVIGDSGWIPLASVTDSAAGLFAAAVEIASTLALVHSSGIIHRNLHSASFMFIKGDKIKCAVSGLEHSARISDPAGMEKNVPRTELEIATASPEMLGLIPFVPDYRSDLYSLGIIFYEMFTGLKPFQCHDQDDLIYSHIAREPVPPSLVSRDVPPVSQIS
jgi:serine/threonine protein kinase